MHTNIAFENLRAEMARNNLTITEISKEIGINRKTLGQKLSHKQPIKLSEAFDIQKRFFPQNTVEYLFHELKKK